VIALSDQRYGRLAETLAAWALRLRGYRVVGQNVRIGGREVDLVARRGSLLNLFGAPADAVGPHKRRRLREAAEMLMADDPTVERVRFDVIAVSGFGVRHLPEAF
jgi:putative endonuclease